MALQTVPLTEHVGIEVMDLSPDALTRPEIAAELDELLARHGVLVFRRIHVDDDTQVAFSRMLGNVQRFPNAVGAHPEILVVSLDPAKSTSAAYFKGTFFWHIDGATDPIPNKATMLSAKDVASDGGDTEFCSTYAAYDTLPQPIKDRIAGLRAVHSFETSQLLAEPDAPEEVRAQWRRRPSRQQPLAWTHRDGRVSLVLGATVTEVVGMDADESRELLEQLHEWSTRPEQVYRHHWSVGDLVIWDNRGTMHRAVPYAADSPRVMHRTTIDGDEAFN